MKYPLNKKHLDYFTKQCEYWKHLLCIQYDIDYDWTNDTGVASQVNYKISQHMATIRLSKQWGIEPTFVALNRVALHEICHLLLAPLTELTMRIYSENMVMEFEHAIITCLENIVDVI